MPNAIAVVAHYDDAILWMGGAIQRLGAVGWKWTVVTMCVQDTGKRDYFARCCNDLGVAPIPMDFSDYQEGDAFRLNGKEPMLRRLTEETRRAEFDLVFTHPLDKGGEYGWHANHNEVANVVATLVNGGSLGRGSPALAHFCYEASYGLGGLATVAKRDATHYLQLTYAELRRKCEWCDRARIIDGSLESLAFPCPNPEAFKGDDLELPTTFVARRRQNTR